jgi:ubiquinol-cytochrome c reductase iron-sulfur subunit
MTTYREISGSAEMTPKERRASAAITVCFLLAAASGAGSIWAYWYTDDIGWMGGLTGAAFLFLAIGLGLWAHHLVPEGPYYEEYPDFRAPPEEEAEALATIDRGGIGRRKVLIGTLGVAGVAIVGGVGSTVRSWGPAPASFAGTPWRKGRTLVDQDGKPIRLDELEVGGAVGVFPEGFITDPDAPCMLIRLPPGTNHPLKGRASWAPNDYICYSKVCTHAGCAVNMYDRRRLDMMCPCHQSTFAVTRGGTPVFGPAVDPLPQLPLAVAADGTLEAGGDLSHPPGPMYWHYIPGVGV